MWTRLYICTYRLQGRRKMICFRGAEINNLTLITFIILITVGASEQSQNEHACTMARKMYEMLAKFAGKIKDIYTHVECGFPHPCPFYGVNAELISFGQGDLLAHSFKQAKSFLKKIINWTSWKIISTQSRRSSHMFCHILN